MGTAGNLVNSRKHKQEQRGLPEARIKTKGSKTILTTFDNSRYGPGGDEEPPNDHDFYQNCQIVPDLQVDYKWGRKVNFQIYPYSAFYGGHRFQCFLCHVIFKGLRHRPLHRQGGGAARCQPGL